MLNNIEWSSKSKRQILKHWNRLPENLWQIVGQIEFSRITLGKTILFFRFQSQSFMCAAIYNTWLLYEETILHDGKLSHLYYIIDTICMSATTLRRTPSSWSVWVRVWRTYTYIHILVEKKPQLSMTIRHMQILIKLLYHNEKRVLKRNWKTER